MILENKQEKEAFKFLFSIASEETSRRGCNDLPNEIMEIFKGLTVPGSDGEKVVQREIVFDFDVCYWLQLQIKIT